MSALDDIITLMGPIPGEEHERRVLMRGHRNAASALIGRTECETARLMGWQVIEWVSPNLYQPAPLEWLDQVNRLSRRLLVTGLQAEEMTLMLRENCNG